METNIQKNRCDQIQGRSPPAFTPGLRIRDRKGALYLQCTDLRANKYSKMKPAKI